MPYIKTTANVSIPPEKCESIKTQLGRDVALLGKSESWLMVDFAESSPLYFKGSSDPSAIVSVDLYGASDAAAYDSFTRAVTEMVSEALSIAPDRIFVKYSEYGTWGWNGNNL